MVSNLISAAKRPWRQPPTNHASWPSFVINPQNLGLNAAWEKANRQRLAEAFSGDLPKGIFPNASQRQRAWLSNALTDLGMLGEAVSEYFGETWSDDYPSLEVLFEHNSDQILEHPLRLNTDAQPKFMLPWHVQDGTNEFTSCNADISRALAQLLPAGFMHRDRLNGDLFDIVVRQFPHLKKVQDYIKQSTVEETLGAKAGQLLRGFTLTNYRTPPGNYNLFPAMWIATLQRNDWPKGLTVSVQARVESGVVKDLSAILTSAEARAARVLKLDWLVSRLGNPETWKLR